MNQMWRTMCFILIVLLVGWASPWAQAQDDRPISFHDSRWQEQSASDEPELLLEEDEDDDGLAPARRRRGLTLDPYAWIYPTTNVRNADGDVFTSHTGFQILLREPLNEKVTLNASIGLEYSKYDFGGDDPFAGTGNDLFENMWQAGVSGTLSYRIDQQWAVFGGGFIGAGFEEKADFDDSIIGGGALGATYFAGEKFRLSFGLTVRSRLEDDALVMPLISVYWQFHETARLETITLPQGFLLGVVTEPFEDWEFGVHGGWQYRQWRLNDSGPAIGQDAVFRDSVVLLAGSAAWKPSPGFNLRLIVGATVYRELDLLDDGGSSIDDPETDPGAFIGLRLNWFF